VQPKDKVNSMPHDVFISYSSKDNQAADTICEILESNQIRCWIAPRDIMPSVPYAEALIDAITESKVFVLVLSANANESPQVIREVERAVNQHIPIIPLRIEDVLLSKQLSYYLGSVHWLDALTPPLEKHLQKLIQTVRSLLDLKSEGKAREAKAFPDAFQKKYRREKGTPSKERIMPEKKPELKKPGKPVLFYLVLAIFLHMAAIVCISALIAGGYLLLSRILRTEKTQAEIISTSIWKNSIAVLPFTDLSLQEEQEYFCDGITEEIIGRLSKLRELKVISRTSVWYYKDTYKDIKEIGRELNVETILEGSVLKEKDNIRVSAQLISSEDRYHLWSEMYDRKLESVFAIQDEISKDIAKALRIELGSREKDLLLKRYTEDFEAYNLYLKGRYFWNKRTEQGYQKSLEYFQKAIEKDPIYALAYTGIADYYNLLGYYDYIPPKEAFLKARAAANKALEIDDTLAEAHNSLAMVKENYDWDWEGAEREYKRAIELNPSYATAHQWYAGYLRAMGRHEESIAENKKAQELDPLSPSIGTALGTNFISARQYDQAIEELQKVFEMDPDYMVAHFFMGLAYTGKGMYKEAIAEAQKALDLSGGEDTLIKAFLGVLYSLSGKRDEAKNVLDELYELSKQKYVSSWAIALIYAALGQKDQAFEWLEKAYEERDHWLPSIKVLPLLDSLRSDPRFKALLKKMDLEE